MGDGFGQDLIRAGCNLDPLFSAVDRIVPGCVLGALEDDDVMLSGDNGQLLGGVIADKDPVITHGGLFFIAEIDCLIDTIKISR